jgi:hypothetical protein
MYRKCIRKNVNGAPFQRNKGTSAVENGNTRWAEEVFMYLYKSVIPNSRGSQIGSQYCGPGSESVSAVGSGTSDRIQIWLIQHELTYVDSISSLPFELLK